MKDPVQVWLSGGSGQDLIEATVILAEAALFDGKNVLQTQSYGFDAELAATEDVELGATKSEVVLSSRKRITYPQVAKPDVLLCLSQHAFGRYFPQANCDTLIILDSTNVTCPAAVGRSAYRFPITETAVRVGHRGLANMVALGAMNELMSLVTPTSLREAISKCVPESHCALNQRALEAGEELLEVYEPE
jgi:2-oxoglutarate ferredoxin oxidoreductase subunit gamma